jgi:hypothetical protein
MAVVPSQSRWLKMRSSSMQITRTTLHRSVTSIPISFSTAMAYAQL